jgi:hypothetical protein
MRAMAFDSGVVRFGEILRALARGRCISAASQHHELLPRPQWRGSRRGRVGGDRAKQGSSSASHLLGCLWAWATLGPTRSCFGSLRSLLFAPLAIHVNRKARAHLFPTLAILSRTHDSLWTKPAEGGGNWLSTCEQEHMSMPGIGGVTEIKTVPSIFWPTLAYVVLHNHPIACHRFRFLEVIRREKTRPS